GLMVAAFTGDLSSLHVLSHLRKLEKLELKGLFNATGEIPGEIQYMTALTGLGLNYIVSVQFPDWVTRLTNLQYLSVDSDYPQRHGRLMNDDISQLTALTRLSFIGNNLEGYLPKGWSTLVNLLELYLKSNQFHGTIPETFSALTSLTIIDLSWNQLSGSIPPAFASSVQSITLTYNAFSGPIPPHLVALPNLSELQISNNMFTGIPSTFTRLTGMTLLDISFNNLRLLNYNNFSGVMPASLTAITGLAKLDIGNNRFTGTFPKFILRQSKLASLDLRNNSFTGVIPHELARLVNLEDINFEDNNFRGPLPFGLLRLPKLYSLEVSNNSISGELPRTLSVSPSLYTLSLGRNQLTGSLPDFSRWNISCVQINLGSNNLTGSIPDSISMLTTLEGIMLNNNQLTGTIPSAIFTMTNLKYLYMANNHLSGTLPDAISRLENLEQIWLDNNKLEGPLPSSLCLLPGLWRFMISNNHLYGPLPDCLFDKCINQIDVSGNSLYGRINRDFKSMVADGGALINLANNFFFGDAVLFAAGCKVCPTEVNEPNNLDLWNISKWMVGGKCNDALVNNSVMGAGSEVRVSLSGNCLTLSPNAGCASHAIQRSKAACKALCSITANGPCDGHGECVQPDPTSPSKFTCLCDAGYSVVDSGNGSTCVIVYSNTTTVSSLSTGAIVGIVLGSFAGFTLLAAVLAWLLWPRGP
ncbi:unnamed protein product, partial [Closterium sp. Naga37s-1]